MHRKALFARIALCAISLGACSSSPTGGDAGMDKPDASGGGGSPDLGSPGQFSCADGPTKLTAACNKLCAAAVAAQCCAIPTQIPQLWDVATVVSCGGGGPPTDAGPRVIDMTECVTACMKQKLGTKCSDEISAFVDCAAGGTCSNGFWAAPKACGTLATPAYLCSQQCLGFAPCKSSTCN